MADAGEPAQGGGRRRASSFVGLTSARVAASFLSALWLIVAANILSIDDFGNLVTLVALATIFIAASDGGLQIVFAHHVAAVGGMDRPSAVAVLRRRVVYAAVCALVLVPAFLVASPGTSVGPALVMGISVIATGVYQTLLTGYRALGRVAMDGMNEALSRLFVLAAGFALLHAGAGLIGGTLAYALADLGSALIVGFLLARRFTRRPLPPVTDIHLRATAPLAVAIVIGVVYYRIDVYLLRLLSDAAEVARYGAAYRLLDATAVPAIALGHTAIAHVVPLHGRRRLREVQRYVLISVAVTVPLALLAALVAPFVFGTLFGPQFASASGLADVLLASSVPGSVVFVLSQLAGVIDKRGLAVASAGALALNVTANLALIPSHGAAGAAWSTVISQSMFAVVLYWIVHTRCAGPAEEIHPVKIEKD